MHSIANMCICMKCRLYQRKDGTKTAKPEYYYMQNRPLANWTNKSQLSHVFKGIRVGVIYS